MAGTVKMLLSMDAALGVNRTKDLEYDEDGYCKVVLSVLDIPNSVGLPYASKPFISVLNNSEGFRRRVLNGQCYGENGHPKPFGMTKMEFFERCQMIEETRHMFHIKDIPYPEVFTDVKTGKRLLGIMGWIKPSGAYGEVLQKQLDNPNENVGFSLRGIAPVNPATMQKELRSLVTWDRVTEVGLPGSWILNTRTKEVSMESFEIAIELSEEEQESALVSLESNEEREALREAFTAFREKPVGFNIQKPKYL